MVSRLPLLALAGALALAGGARAAETQAAHTFPAITVSAPDGRDTAGRLRPFDARVVALGEGSAVVYYTQDPKGPMGSGSSQPSEPTLPARPLRPAS